MSLTDSFDLGLDGWLAASTGQDILVSLGDTLGPWKSVLSD